MERSLIKLEMLTQADLSLELHAELLSSMPGWSLPGTSDMTQYIHRVEDLQPSLAVADRAARTLSIDDARFETGDHPHNGSQHVQHLAMSTHHTLAGGCLSRQTTS